MINFIIVKNRSLLLRLGNFTSYIIDMQVYWSVLNFYLLLETYYLEGIDNNNNLFIFFKVI